MVHMLWIHLGIASKSIHVVHALKERALSPHTVACGFSAFSGFGEIKTFGLVARNVVYGYVTRLGSYYPAQLQRLAKISTVPVCKYNY